MQEPTKKQKNRGKRTTKLSRPAQHPCGCGDRGGSASGASGGSAASNGDCGCSDGGCGDHRISHHSRRFVGRSDGKSIKDHNIGHPSIGIVRIAGSPVRCPSKVLWEQCNGNEHVQNRHDEWYGFNCKATGTDTMNDKGSIARLESGSNNHFYPSFIDASGEGGGGGARKERDTRRDNEREEKEERRSNRVGPSRLRRHVHLLHNTGNPVAPRAAARAGTLEQLSISVPFDGVWVWLVSGKGKGCEESGRERMMGLDGGPHREEGIKKRRSKMPCQEPESNR